MRRRKTESAEYGKKFQRTRKMQTIFKKYRHAARPAMHLRIKKNDKKEMRASGLAEIAKVLQTTPNYLLGFADNNDGFADEALGLLRDVKDQSVREILLKQIMALI